MFALHYFFVTEHSLRTFLQNVADNLKPGAWHVARGDAWGHGTWQGLRLTLHTVLGGSPIVRGSTAHSATACHVGTSGDELGYLLRHASNDGACVHRCLPLPPTPFVY